MAPTVAERSTTIEAPQKWSATKSWASTTIEYTMVLLVALLCLEPLLTLAGAANDQILQIDQVTGWTPMANRSYGFKREWFCRDSFNSMGLRGPETTFAKPADTVRIAVLGDSLTAGLQVPYDKTYCADLERMLAEPGAKKKVEVINFGVSAYNLGQAYLRLNTFAFKFNPDIVILAVRPLAVYTQVHGQNVMGLPPPEFAIDSYGGLVCDRHKEIEWLDSSAGKAAVASNWLRRNSRLWGFVAICAEQLKVPFDQLHAFFGKPLARLAKLARKHSKVADINPAAAPSRDDFVYGSEVVEGLIRQAHIECLNRGCRLIVVYMPDLKHVTDPREPLVLRQTTSNLSIDYLDLNPAFGKIERQPHEPFVFTHHYNAFGHRTVARELAAFIEQKRIIE